MKVGDSAGHGRPHNKFFAPDDSSVTDDGRGGATRKGAMHTVAKRSETRRQHYRQPFEIRTMK
jgi:hypothetical protein